MKKFSFIILSVIIMSLLGLGEIHGVPTDSSAYSAKDSTEVKKSKSEKKSATEKKSTAEKKSTPKKVRERKTVTKKTSDKSVTSKSNKISVRKDKLTKGAPSARSYNDPRVAGPSLAILLNEYSTMADTIAREISEKNKKSPAIQTEIARAYFRNNDRENTRKYLEKAMAIDKNYSPAYNLKGRSYGVYDKEKKMFVLAPADADSACYWFDKAIAVDPKNPQPYLDYADAMSWKNMPAALAKMEELRKNIPSYNVDLAIAELYETKIKRSGTAEEAAAARVASDNYVAKLDPHKLSSNQLAKFAMAAFWASNTEKAEELALIGTEKFPKNKDYNRVVGWAAARNGHYETALKYLNKYYSLVPKDSIEKLDLRSMDNLSYGISDLNLEHYGMAVSDFKDALATNDDYTSQMPMQVNSAFNGKFRKLIAEKKYEEAYNMYPQYIAIVDDSLKAEKWAYMFDQYLYKMDEADDEGKQELLTYMDKVAETLGNEYPEYEDLPKIYYYEMVYTQQVYDSESTEGTAVPIAEKLLGCVSGTPLEDLKSNVKNYAATACNIIAFYDFKGQNNTAAATRYWQKALYYNPDDAQARSVLSQLHALPKSGSASTSTTKSTKKSKRRR